jgi:hypothetical protein
MGGAMQRNTNRVPGTASPVAAAHLPRGVAASRRSVGMVVALAALMALLTPAPGTAIIGNDLLGKSFCVVACGDGRGIFNTQILGDASTHLLFDPPIDKLAQKFDGLGEKYAQRFDSILDDKYAKLEDLSRRSIEDLGRTLDEAGRKNIDLLSRTADQKLDRIDRMADDKLDRVDAMADDKLGTLDRMADDKLGKFADLLDDTSRNAVDDFDQTLARNLEEMDNRISLQQGQFKANVEDSSDRFVSRLYLFGFFLIVGFVAVSFHRAWLRNPAIFRKPATLASLILVPLGIAGLGYAVYRHANETASPEVRWAETRDSALRNQNWLEALSSSQALISTYPEDAGHRLMHEKILLLRLFIERPTFLYDASELEHFMQRATEYSREHYALAGKIDPDVLAVVAIILAHRGENRLAHHAAAAYASIALESGDGLPPAYRERLAYVLLAYLQDPLSDREVRAAFGTTLKVAGAMTVPVPTTAQLAERAGRELPPILDGDLLFKLRLRGMIVRTSRVFAELNNALITLGPEDSRFRAALDAAKALSEEWRTLPATDVYKRASRRAKLLVLERPYAVQDALDRFARLPRPLPLAIQGDCFVRSPGVAQAVVLTTLLADDKALRDADIGIVDAEGADLLTMSIAADLARLTAEGALSRRKAGAELVRTLERERSHRESIGRMFALPWLYRHDLGEQGDCRLELRSTSVAAEVAPAAECASDADGCGTDAYGRLLVDADPVPSGASVVGNDGDAAAPASSAGRMTVDGPAPQRLIADMGGEPGFEILLAMMSIRRCATAEACARDARVYALADKPLIELALFRDMPEMKARIDAQSTRAVASIY